jgi:hypothetical protein
MEAQTDGLRLQNIMKVTYIPLGKVIKEHIYTELR